MSARWYEAHVTDGGRALLLIRVVAYDQPDGWDLTWVSPAGDEDADRSRFEAVVETFQLSEALRNVWKLAVGECFGSLPISQPASAGKSAVFMGPVDEFLEVPCDAIHTGEVISAFQASADVDCDRYFEPFVGRPLKGSAYALLAFFPMPRRGAIEGDGFEVRCVVANASGAAEGTARGSRK
jgi:hypothetical protein